MNKLSIQPNFSMNDWPQLDRFISVTHGENHILRQTPLFDWLFRRNSNHNLANLIVAYEGNKLIALLGYMPTRFLWGKEIIVGAWMAHWMTLPEYRHGIGALLMRKMTELYPILASQGASEMNRMIVEKMGFSFQDKIPKVVYVLNPDKVKEKFNYTCIGPKKLHSHSGADLKEVNSLSPDIYAPDWDLYPSLMYGTLRDHNYLTHRFLKYPFFKYHIFIEGSPSSPSICVVRIVYTNEAITVGRILDFFYPETPQGEEQAKTLMQKCIRFFSEKNCDYVDYYCTSSAYTNLLLEIGFSEDSEGGLPSLLDPIDTSRKHQNCELYISTELKHKYKNSENKFFVSRSDCDQDRPNSTLRNINT